MSLTQAQMITQLLNEGYVLQSDATNKGFNRLVYIHPSGLTATIASNGAAHTVGAQNSNRLNNQGNTVSIGTLDQVSVHLIAIHGK